MAFKMPDMDYELGMLELKQGETIDFLWFRMTILRSDLELPGWKAWDKI